MSKVIHFEIPCKRSKRSIKFYKNIFNWKFKKWGKDDFWLIKTGPKNEGGIHGSLIKKNNLHQVITNTISVKNIDKTIKKIIKEGGKILMDKTAIPGIGFLVYFSDPDQNLIGIMQADENAL